MKVINLNDKLGDPVVFESLEEYQNAIKEFCLEDWNCEMPELIEGVDYEYVEDEETNV